MSNNNLLRQYRKEKKIDSRFYSTSRQSLLNEIDEVSDMYYLAMMTHSGEDDLAVDMPLILGTDNFLKLLEYYGGRTLRMPTLESIQDSLLGVMSYYYSNVKSYSWNRTLEALNVPPTPGNKRMVSMRYNRVKDLLEGKSVQVPGAVSKPRDDMDEEVVESESSLVKCRGRYVIKDDYTASVRTIFEVLLEDNKITREEYDQYLEEYVDE